MKYTIEDTPQGFRLTAHASDTSGTRLVYDEIGGHGPAEKLYEHASATFHDVRGNVEHTS